MAYYIAFIDGKSGAFGAAFPDAPGCTAMGASTEEVLENAGTALREWMADRIADGFAPPQARSYDEIMSDHTSGWETNHCIANIPLLLDSGRSVRANISLDAGLLQQIDEAAKQRGLTRSSFLASAAREKIAQQR